MGDDDNNNKDTALETALALAESYKNEGNSAFQLGNNEEAIRLYTQAIELDPENAVYYSNRSAAFLKGDSKSKALKDAMKCIELKPNWVKGYSRKGAAEHALTRYDAARETYLLGLKLDPENALLLEAIEDVREAGLEHSRLLKERAAKQKELEAHREALLQKQKEINQQKEQEKKESQQKDDVLAAFFGEVEDLEQQATSAPLKPKTEINFGTAEQQIQRLLQHHYNWINLNPFTVLMLDHEATEEDLKQHYRKLSALVHPDKCRHPKAREAFEEVKKANELLQNKDKWTTYVQLIKNVKKKVLKERKMKLKKGIPLSVLGEEKEAISIGIMKEFASMENRRRNLEIREAAQNKRETEQQDEDQKKMVEDYKRERTWADDDRREGRVGSWRGFQKDGNKRKAIAAGWKEERRPSEKKFGVVENDDYKKKWK